MKNCEMIEKCPFFNDKMSGKPGIGKMYKKRYCMNDNSDCARYMVVKAIGADKTPSALTSSNRICFPVIRSYVNIPNLSGSLSSDPCGVTNNAILDESGDHAGGDRTHAMT